MGRSRSTSRPPRTSSSSSATGSAHSPTVRYASTRSPASSASASSTRSPARRSPSSTCRRPQALFDKQGKLDQILVGAKPGVSEAELVRQIDPLLTETTEVKTATAQAKSESQDSQDGMAHLPDDPARLRRHRALRGQLRDREHALDHRRAADARAGDAADARRLAQAGALVRRARVGRRRRDRVDRRPVRGARDRQGSLRAPGGDGARPPPGDPRARPPHGRSSASASAP